MSIADMFVATQDTDTHRVCGTCGKLKPVEDFYKDGKDKKQASQNTGAIVKTVTKQRVLVRLN